MTPIAPHMEAFLRQRLPVERGASINTCDSYAYAFRLLLQYASECLKVRPSDLQLEQLDAPLILNFLKYLKTTRHNGQNSRNTRLAAIKSFMHFMEYRVPSALEQMRRVLAIPAKKTDARLVRHLSVEELQSILDAPSPSRLDGIRDRAMLHLCFAAALRVSKLVGLQLNDMKLQPQASVLIHGKGRRQRCLPLWKETTAAVRSWLAVRPCASAPELFLNARGQAMTRAGFEYILRKHVRTATERRPSPRKRRYATPGASRAAHRRIASFSPRCASRVDSSTRRSKTSCSHELRIGVSSLFWGVAELTSCKQRSGCARAGPRVVDGLANAVGVPELRVTLDLA